MSWNNTYSLMRHGESVANIEGRIASSRAAAEKNFGLTSRGRRQVRKATGNALKAGILGDGLIVYTSPFLRTRQSAAVVLESVVVSRVVSDDRLMERNFGELDLSSDTNYETVWRSDRSRAPSDVSGLESIDSVSARIHALVQQIEERYCGTSVLLVTHGDVAQIATCLFLGLPIEDHRAWKLDTGHIRDLSSLLHHSAPRREDS